MIKIAIIGLGTISSVHREAIDECNFAQLVAVCDTLPSQFVGYEEIPCFTDISEMLDSAQPNCVHICLPHFLHLPVIELCAKRGINVFTEKPLAMNYEECEKTFDLEKKHGVKIGVCLQNRYNVTTVEARRLMASGELGRFLGSKGVVTWCREKSYYDEAPWRSTLREAGGGVIINQAIHTLDLLYHVGGDVSSIKGRLASLALDNIEVEDSAMATLRYSSGARGVFFATVGYVDNSSVLLEFVFEKEILTITDGVLYRQKRAGGERVLVAENRPKSGSKHYYGSEHSEAINRFYRSVIDGTDDYINVHEGAYSLRLLDEIR